MTRTLTRGPAPIAAAVLALCPPVTGLSAEQSADLRPTASPERLRVGLVLGGGGARGSAHIGVLQELERMRIPIDAIVGTSMGAIVGGLYASGMSPAELELLVSTLDWARALDDRPDRVNLPYRRKQDDERFPIRLELGLRDGRIALPQGVVQGHQLDLLLRDLTLDVAATTDFDDLIIPFRAVASDLATGEAHVMGEGDLALAIRASMSVPGVLAPVATDGRLLVDGGIVGNLGIDVMQDLGVDVIIAVDVEFPLLDLEQLTSALSISEQVLTILIRRETLRQIARLSGDDVLLRPDLGQLGSTDFGSSPATIEPGVAAVRMHADRLSRLSLDARAYEDYRQARRRPPPAGQTIAFARVVDGDGEPVDELTGQLGVEPGDPVDAGVFSDEADRLLGAGAFERVGYSLVEDGGRTGVEFRASARSWGRDFMRFGLSIENDFEGSTAFNFATRIWRPDVNRLGGEWRTDLRVGTLPLLASELYQPVGADSRYFVSPRVVLSQRDISSFVDDERVARLRVSEAVLGFDAGASLGKAGEFRIGAYRGDGNARVKVGDPGIPNLSYNIGGTFARLSLDTFDNAHFPRSGLRGDILWDLSRTGLGADESYETLSLNFNKAWSRGRNTLIAGLDFATSTGADAVVQARFPLGGFLRLSGLERGQLSGPHAGVARLLYYRRLGTTGGGLVDIPIYAGATVEGGNVWKSRDEIGFDSLLANGSLFLGLDTYLGPLFLAAGYAENGGSNFYLFIGAIPD